MCREIKDLGCRVRTTYNGEQTGFSYLTVPGYFNWSWLFNAKIIDWYILKTDAGDRAV